MVSYQADVSSSSVRINSIFIAADGSIRSGRGSQACSLGNNPWSIECGAPCYIAHNLFREILVMKGYLTWLAKFITGAVVLAFCIPFLLAGLVGAISGSAVKAPVKSAKGVAVVEIEGMIIDSKKILEELYKHSANDDVLGIVLDINSPGGAVGPSQAIYSTVRALAERKPTIAVMGSVAASGGLYAALGAKKILAQPGTLTGSIGVILQLPNFSKIADQYGFQMITIKSGELKDVGNSFRPMTKSDRDFLQASVDKVREEFVDAVVSGRGIERDVVDSIGDGRIILGSEALEYGMIDGYGTIYDASREIYEMAGVPLDQEAIPNLIYEKDQFSQLKKFFREGVFADLLNSISPRLELR
ncbi:signal peptide peptidase SppA [bacterium]|nr:signal peptide peptidase SppA [bacterium]